MDRVVDRGQPFQLHREDHDQQWTGEERRDGKTDHRDKGADIVERGILAIGGINADRQSDQDRNDIGNTNNPEGLWDPLHHDIHHRRPRLPGNHPQLTFGEIGSKDVVDDNLRLDPEYLNQPFVILDIPCLTQAKRFAHLLFDFRGDSKRNLGHRVSRGQLQKQKNRQTDKDQSWYGQNQATNGIGQHTLSLTRLLFVLGTLKQMIREAQQKCASRALLDQVPIT